MHDGENAEFILATGIQESVRETLAQPMLAAVANAVFDATGVRMRRVPLTPARVLAASGA